MSKHDRKDLPATVPERGRARSGANDATIIAPPLEQDRADAAPESGLPPSTAKTPSRLESSLPIYETTEGIPGAPSRELIVPSSATVDSIMTEVRRPASTRLDIETRLAAGGMGTIEIAVDRALDRRIAIKTLHPHLRSDETSLRMFLREARLTALLDHPHIVPLYDLAERSFGSPYFAMKLVEGKTLAALIRALPRGLPDAATLYALLDVVTKVCDALAFAHSKGVLHCDVKPANVMVGEFGQVYLMDWGIARLAAADPAPGSFADPKQGPPNASPSATDNSVIGTPAYMSPEQARGDRKKLDVRSDVFLLGALLYEVLTRRAPYANPDRNETLALAVGGTFPSPRKVAGDGVVPPELDRIVMRAMAKSPLDRYETVLALKDDLVRFMRGGAEFPRRTFAAGDVILREGETGAAAYIIVDGRCDVQKAIPTGTQTVLSLGPGDVFGETAILSPGPRTATVVAAIPTTVLVVTANELEAEMATLKPWVATLLKSLATRFRDVDAAQRASYAGASPRDVNARARLANQLVMQLSTWGNRDASGARTMAWSKLVSDTEAQLGLPLLAALDAAVAYGLVVDLDADTVTMVDEAPIVARLRIDLT